MRDAVFFFIWLVLLPISFYSAHIGVLLWIWVALLSPNELLYGVMAGVPFNKIVAGSTVLLLMVSKERKRFYMDPLILLVAAYGILVTLSYLTMEHPGSFADHEFDKIYKEIVLAWLITGIMWSRHRLHQAFLVISVSYGFLMVKEAMIFIFTAGGHEIAGTASTGDNNGLALAILMVIPLALFVAKYSAVRLVRTGILATAGLGVVTVIASFSRGGFVGLVAMALMLLRGSRYKARALVMFAVGGVLVWILAPESWFARISTIKEASDDGSFITRLVAWKINFMMALEHPILGNGPFASLAWENWSKYLEASTTYLFPTPAIDHSFVAHSIYFQALGDIGFLGLAVFVSMLGMSFILLRRTRRMTRKVPSLAWADDMARALQTSMVVYCIAGAALSLIYFELLFITLALVSRLHQSVRELTRAVPAEKAAAPARVAGRLAPAYRAAN